MLEIFKKFKKTNEILQNLTADFECASELNNQNLLISADNLNAMAFLLQNNFQNSVDLVYIDPPFATNNTFRMGGTISSSNNSKIAYNDKFTLENYLEFLYERFVLIREIMSEKGSIYVHIDNKVGHYVKILLDFVFGRQNFINDITRIKCNPKNFERKGYGNIKDCILFYSKTDHFIWNNICEKVSKNDLSKRFNKRDEKGFYTTVPLHAPGETKNGESGQEWQGIKPPTGRHWRCSLRELDRLQNEGLIEWSKTGNPRKKIYAHDYTHKKIQDIWEFKDSQRVLYPTQKNSSLLQQIVAMSSNENSRVMDCFCGSGSFLQEAYKMGRKFIGIDEGTEAIRINQRMLKDYYLIEQRVSDLRFTLTAAPEPYLF